MSARDLARRLAVTEPVPGRTREGAALDRVDSTLREAFDLAVSVHGVSDALAAIVGALYARGEGTDKRAAFATLASAIDKACAAAECEDAIDAIDDSGHLQPEADRMMAVLTGDT